MSSMTSEQRAADRLLAGDQIRLIHSVLAGHRRRFGRGGLAGSGLGRRQRLARLTAVGRTAPTHAAVADSGGRRTT